MVSASLDLVRVVLVDTSHPGNIGAAARAMRAMGLARLYLVRPKDFPSAEATARAAGAVAGLHVAVERHVVGAASGRQQDAAGAVGRIGCQRGMGLHAEAVAVTALVDRDRAVGRDQLDRTVGGCLQVRQAGVHHGRSGRVEVDLLNREDAGGVDRDSGQFLDVDAGAAAGRQRPVRSY